MGMKENKLCSRTHSRQIQFVVILSTWVAKLLVKKPFIVKKSGALVANEF